MEVREREEKEKTVMTEEQMEILRRQISVYSFICELLVDMHKSFTSHNPSLSGMKLGNMYCDPLMASGGLNISARHRWAPTPVQLQVLESIFSQGNGAPGKKKIKEITSELTQHGPISETNVYNWFQNRRSRSKRKQQQQFTNNVDSEVETEAESPKEKKAKVETMLSHENPAPRADDQFFRSLGRGSEVYSLDPWPSEAQVAFPPNNGSRSSGGMVTYLSTRACCRPKYAPAHEELYDPFARDMLGVIGPHVCTTCAHALLIKNVDMIGPAVDGGCPKNLPDWTILTRLSAICK